MAESIFVTRACDFIVLSWCVCVPVFFFFFLMCCVCVLCVSCNVFLMSPPFPTAWLTVMAWPLSIMVHEPSSTPFVHDKRLCYQHLLSLWYTKRVYYTHIKKHQICYCDKLHHIQTIWWEWWRMFCVWEKLPRFVVRMHHFCHIVEKLPNPISFSTVSLSLTRFSSLTPSTASIGKGREKLLEEKREE